MILSCKGATNIVFLPMAITRSQIARQLLQQGGVSMVDPRMQRSLEENIARNNAAREINQAMRKPGGLRDLYQKYGFSNPQIDLKFAPFASRNRFMELSKRENLIKEIVGKNRRVQSANPPQMGNQFVGGPDPLSQQMAERDRIIAKNQRIFREYMNQQMGTAGSIPSIGMGKTLIGPVGPGTTPPEKDQSLISRLTKLTPLQATRFDPFEQLSDIDQYTLSLAYPSAVIKSSSKVSGS